MAQKEVKQWITINGKHIPIFEGQSKDDIVKAYVKHDHPSKSGEYKSTKSTSGPEVTVKPGTKVKISDKKDYQIAKNKEQADKAKTGRTITDNNDTIAEKNGWKKREDGLSGYKNEDGWEATRENHGAKGGFWNIAKYDTNKLNKYGGYSIKEYGGQGKTFKDALIDFNNNSVAKSQNYKLQKQVKGRILSKDDIVFIKKANSFGQPIYAYDNMTEELIGKFKTGEDVFNKYSGIEITGGPFKDKDGKVKFYS